MDTTGNRPQPNPPLRLVPARPDQLDEFVEFLEEVAEWLDARGIHQWRPGDFRRSRHFFGESIRRGEVWLVYADEELVGTLRVLLAEPKVWPDVAKDDAIYLFTLAVARSWAGRGVGDALLAWADGYARDLERSYLRLDCMADNEFLKDYYALSGFTPCGEIEVIYPAPIGRLRLARFQRRIDGC